MIPLPTLPLRLTCFGLAIIRLLVRSLLRGVWSEKDLRSVVDVPRDRAFASTIHFRTLIRFAATFEHRIASQRASYDHALTPRAASMDRDESDQPNSAPSRTGPWRHPFGLLVIVGLTRGISQLPADKSVWCAKRLATRTEAPVSDRFSRPRETAQPARRAPALSRFAHPRPYILSAAIA